MISCNLTHLESDSFEGIENTLTKISAASKEGSGIGLTLVQHIVEVLKGEITVESKENSGSTFIVSFPVSNDSH